MKFVKIILLTPIILLGLFGLLFIIVMERLDEKTGH